MRVVVTKSSLRHSVGKTRSSTWELGKNSKKDRHTAVSVILVVLINSGTGESQIDCNLGSSNLLSSRQSWENRFCHDVSDIQDVNQCELYPFNPDLDGSPMRCCIPGDRSTCETRFIQPLGLTGSASGCAARKIWSRRFKRCVPLFFG